jgi:cytochrome c peroxidase
MRRLRFARGGALLRRDAVRKQLRYSIAIALFVAGLGAAADDYQWKLPPGLRPPLVPADNPMTAEKVALGERLFSDGRLSLTGSYSCASCHVPALAFTDGRKTAVGATGQLHARNTPSLVNVAYAVTFGWADPSVTSLEAQHRVPMFNHMPVELGLDQVLPPRLKELDADSALASMRATAFPDAPPGFTLDEVVQSIASYVRTLISADSAFDRYFYWGDDSLTPEARRGMRLFFSDRTSCSLCHASFNLSGPVAEQGIPLPPPVFHNTGLYNVGGTGAYPDPGLAAHTGRDDDIGAFRAPSLRNVAITAPYMHDGSITTLADVIEFYDAGGRNVKNGPYAGDGRLNPHKRAQIHTLNLTDAEKRELVAFLESLTDARYAESAGNDASPH